MSSKKLPAALVERFALEYLKDLNATQAYLRVKPKVKATTAATEGSRLLGKPETGEIIRRLRMEQQDRLKIDADTVLRELAICGYSDVLDYVQNEATGRVSLAPGAHPLASRALSSVKHKTITRGEGKDAITEHTAELRLWDKPGTLRTLAQHLGLVGKDEGGGAAVTLTVRWQNE